jgi:hypothetical protein
MPSKKRRGPHSIKSKKKKKNQQVRIEANKLNHLPKPTNLSEQDPKRRIGHHSGTATPPLMKK